MLGAGMTIAPITQRLLGTALLALLTPVAASAASGFAGEFLAVGAGARGMALGNAYVAFADDATSVAPAPCGGSSTASASACCVSASTASSSPNCRMPPRPSVPTTAPSSPPTSRQRTTLCSSRGDGASASVSMWASAAR
jgi:hypothetical protein